MQQTQAPKIPGFIIGDRIAKGGMAYVFRAVQEGLNRDVAIKILKPDLAENSQIREQFLLEGRIIAGLRHPNIVQVYASGERNGNCYLAMELLSGGTLQDRIKAGLTAAESVRIVRAIASALIGVHQRKFIHRDIKPQNIVFRGDGVPVVTDFGIAKTYVEEWEAERTQSGIKKGTVRYMSPEQIKGLELDGRSDLYSLGVVFYWMLTGERPYDANTLQTLLTKVLQEPIPPLPETLALYQPIMDKLLAKDRDERFADAEALIQALDQLPGHQAPAAAPDEPVAPPVAKPQRDRKPLFYALGGAVLAAILTVVVLKFIMVDPEVELRREIAEQIQDLIAAEALAQEQHEKAMDSKKSSLADLRQQLKDLEREFAENQARREKELADLQAQQDSLEARRDAQKTELERLQNGNDEEIKNEREKVAALKAEIAELESQRDSIDVDGTLEELIAERQRLEDQQKQVQETIASLRADSDQARVNAEKEVERARSELTTLNGELDGLVNELKTARAGYEEELKKLQAQREMLRERIATQEDQIIAQTGELETQVAQLRETLSQEEESYTTKITRLQREFDSLQETRDQLSGRLDQADGSDPMVATLQEQLTTAEGALDTLQRSLADVVLPVPPPDEAIALLDEARGLIAQDQLTLGARNALGVCREIVELHPATGDECLKQIGDRFLALTLAKLNEEDLNTANRYLQAGLDIRPDHTLLTGLKRSQSLLEEAKSLIQGGKLLVDGESDGLGRLLAAREAAPDNPLVRGELDTLADTVRTGSGLDTGDMSRQTLALTEGLDVISKLITRFPDEPVLAALNTALDARLAEARALQEQEMALLLEAQSLADAGQFDQSVSPNACEAYQRVLAVNPANDEAQEVVSSSGRCLEGIVVEQINEALASVSEPPALEDQHAYIEILGLAPRYHQACEGLSQIAGTVQRNAQNLGPEETEQALLMAKQGLDLWPGHPELASLATTLREGVEPGRADALIDQAYNRQVRERVQEAWALYQQALAIDPQNDRAKQEIPKLARWSLAYRSRNLDYVVLADQVYRELLRMGEPLDTLEERLDRIDQLYSGRHAGQSIAQHRLASLRVLRKNQGHTPVTDCALGTLAEAQ